MIYIFDKIIPYTLFPDNTSQVWHFSQSDIISMRGNQPVMIKWEFENEGEFLRLAQLVLLLYNLRCFNIQLYLPYLPYGRQDKIISNDTTFALRVFALFLNNLNISKVEILDPHSSIALNLINNSEPIYCEEELSYLFRIKDIDYIFYPDVGASTKYTKIYNYPSIAGEKKRSSSDGEILDVNLHNKEDEEKVKDKNILIVDDICDGGSTFICWSKKLYELGAKEVHLFTTNAIFSKGLKVLKDAGILSIFTRKGEPNQTREGYIDYNNHRRFYK